MDFKFIKFDFLEESFKFTCLFTSFMILVNWVYIFELEMIDFMCMLLMLEFGELSWRLREATGDHHDDLSADGGPCKQWCKLWKET